MTTCSGAAPMTRRTESPRYHRPSTMPSRVHAHAQIRPRFEALRLEPIYVGLDVIEQLVHATGGPFQRSDASVVC